MDSGGHALDLTFRGKVPGYFLTISKQLYFDFFSGLLVEFTIHPSQVQFLRLHPVDTHQFVATLNAGLVSR